MKLTGKDGLSAAVKKHVRWLAPLVLLFSFQARGQEGEIMVAPLKDVSDVPSLSGLLPAPVILDHLVPPMGPRDPAPLAWDWRDHNGVTPAKQQWPDGTCWAFASAGSMESLVLLEEDQVNDFAEMEVIKGNYSGKTCSSGGNAYHGCFYYGLDGTADEACNPYYNSTSPPNCVSGSYLGCPLQNRLSRWEVICGDVVDNAQIKDALYNYGPVYTTMYSSDPPFNSGYDGGTVYAPGSWPANDHAVLIAGYDDTMPNGGGGFGVWYVKNSWGGGWGNSGYFTIAYDSYGIGKDSAVFAGYLNHPEALVPHTYEEDYPWWAIGYGDGDDWGAIRITPAVTGYLHHVGFYAEASNTSYSIKIYDNWNNGSPTVQMNTTQNGALARYGYYAIELDQPIPVTSGNEIVVLVGLNTPGYSYPIPYDANSPLETDKSYISSSGSNGTWYVIDNGNATPYGDVAYRILVSPDTEGDGLSDWEEGNYGSNPNAADSDGDGLGDYEEVYIHNTSPTTWDTDGDHQPDPYELANLANPEGPLDPNNAGDGAADFDGDGNSNAHEYWNDSDPWTTDPVPDPFRNPACYYWGDGDGDGVVGPGDVAKLQQEIAGSGQSYPNIIPQAFDTLDLDKDGTAGPGDKALLDTMLVNGLRVAAFPSAADTLSVAYQPPGPVAQGSTTHVTLSVGNVLGPVPNSGGFGVVFWVDPASTGSATLLGGEGTDLGSAADNRYDVSGLSAAGANANIVLRVDAPGNIILKARVPACGSKPDGRWCDEALLSPAITITGQ